MFKFLKQKLQGWFKSSEEEVEKKAKKAAPAKKEKKPEKPVKKAKPAEQETHKKRTKTELVEERKIGGDLIEDIKKEKGTEEIRPIPRQEEIEAEIKEVEAEEKEEENLRKTSQEEPEKKGFWQKIKSSFSYRITEEDFESIFSSLEEILLENNTALDVVDHIKETLKKELVNQEVKKEKIEEKIKQALSSSLESLFMPGINILEKIKQKKPFVIVLFGINGSGKTTTIAKLANYLNKNKLSSVFAASDTFRAASIEQLRIHGEKLGIKTISQSYGADPAAVAFDAIEYAKSHKIDVVLIDTAGRMHTKDSLMKEMEKVVRVTKPDLKIFIAESIAGNDAIEQAKIFSETIGVDGIILSKADIDEKGGTSLSVSFITKKPILFLGTGQEYKDLEPFDKEKFLKDLEL